MPGSPAHAGIDRTAPSSARSWWWRSQPPGWCAACSRLADRGQSLLDITKTLNAEGIASPTGQRWLKTTVQKVLTNEVYTGTLVWGANAKDQAPPVRVEQAFPALVSPAQFRRVATLLEVESAGQGASPAVRQLLPAQWVGQVPALWSGALRAGGQARAVRLLCLPVAAPPGTRCLRCPPAQRAALRGPDCGADPGEHSDGAQHPGPGAAGGRGTGRGGPRAAPETGRPRDGVGGGPAPLSTACGR